MSHNICENKKKKTERKIIMTKVATAILSFISSNISSMLVISGLVLFLAIATICVCSIVVNQRYEKVYEDITKYMRDVKENYNDEQEQ